MKQFSFLLPTRGNPSQAKRFLQSVCDTVGDPTAIEVILGVDEDDLPSHDITCDGLCTKTLILPAGLTMGNLNRACFEASSGKYVMLINDDVIVHTQGWDTTVYRAFAQYEDDIALIHVNDLLFRDGLCTFPILSRKACLAIGICPACYQRYRIDDHIYDTYYLLSYLGYNRLTYLDDVVFEHDNYAHRRPRESEGVSFFESPEGKVYIPQPEILKHDSPAFHERLEERKRNARQLAGLIENAAEDRRQTAYSIRLKKVDDSHDYRRHCPPARKLSAAPGKPNSPRVTVAVVTSDFRKPHARKCLSLVKKHTANFDLIVLDNSGSKNFNHASEMNRVLHIAKTDHLVLLDDDVFVTPGWLDGMLDAMDDRTAVVTPLHRNGRGHLSYSGVCVLGDGTGQHTIDVPDAPRVTQCICSAAILIDRRKCEGISFDQHYRKYRFDWDYSLRVWEGGYRVVCTPASQVTHLGEGTISSWRSAESRAAVDHDIALFAAVWIANDRLAGIQENVWPQYDYLQQITNLQREVNRLFQQCNETDWRQWQGNVERTLVTARHFSPIHESILAQLHPWKNAWYSMKMAEQADWAERLIDRYASGSRLRRFTGRIRRKASQMVNNRVIPMIRPFVRSINQRAARD